MCCLQDASHLEHEDSGLTECGPAALLSLLELPAAIVKATALGTTGYGSTVDAKIELETKDTS